MSAILPQNAHCASKRVIGAAKYTAVPVARPASFEHKTLPRRERGGANSATVQRGEVFRVRFDFNGKCRVAHPIHTSTFEKDGGGCVICKHRIDTGRTQDFGTESTVTLPDHLVSPDRYKGP